MHYVWRSLKIYFITYNQYGLYSLCDSPKDAGDDPIKKYLKDLMLNIYKIDENFRLNAWSNFLIIFHH